jgi:predicted ATPase
LAAAYNKLGINSRVELTAHVLRSDKVKDETRSRPSNLPAFLATLFGRECEIREITTLLESHRLVTLVGAGGVGKTRCALQVGAEALDAFADGVWFVDLAPLTDPSSVPNAMVAVFEIQESLKRPMLDTLVAHLKSKNLLIVLDNCEHVVGEASKAAAAILRAAPRVSVVATSREHLGVPGEANYRVPSLSVPETPYLAAKDALAYGAIALFEARARAVNSRFEITDDNAPVVADVCRRLDGIPLAIELAAARVKVLTPKQLAQKLDERFRLLTGGDRTALPRHQTMRAAIGWSYNLLSESEQLLFRSLSIFAGSFSLEAASAVCASGSIEEFEVIDLLSSLVDKSLANVEHAVDEARYRMFESTRQYAREKLIELGELDDLSTRHGAAYAQIAERLQRDYETTPRRTWLALAEWEQENVRAALSWAFAADGDVAIGQRLAATLGRVMVPFAAVEALRWMQTAQGRVDAGTSPSILAKLALAEARVASTVMQPNLALSAAQRALALFVQLNDTAGAARAKRWVGRSLVYLGRPTEGKALLEEALATQRALGSRFLGALLRDLGAARAAEGDVNGARTLFAQALASYRESADDGNVVVTASALAESEFQHGAAEEALSFAEEALAAARGLRHHRQMVAGLLSNTAMFFVALGCHEAARARAREGLLLARELQTDVIVAVAMQHLAAVAALRPCGGAAAESADRRRSARLVGFVDVLLAQLECVRAFGEQREYDTVLSTLRETLGAEPLETSMAEGLLWNLDQAVREALSV